MQRVSQEILDGLMEFDSATVFNGMVQKLGLPNVEYTSHEIRCLLPDLGRVIGYAVTIEVTTNDDDSPALDWSDYYQYIHDIEGPIITVMKDVDSQPGRGACFGDGMAYLHRRLDVVGALVEGTVRDLEGIHGAGLPIWAWGTVPGHGVFNVTRFGSPITVGQLRIRPGDLILADNDGSVRIPNEHAAEILRCASEVRAREAKIFEFYQSPDFSMEKLREQRKS